MNSENTIYTAQYFTATIYKWQTALADDSHKDITIDSLQYLVNDKRIELNAYVIMSNHIHLTCLLARQVWQALPGFTPSGVQ